MSEFRKFKAMPVRDMKPGSEHGCRVCEVRRSDDALLKPRVFTGSYPACVEFIKAHRPRRGHEFGIIYNESGRMASFVA